jgi:hypothetical protein
MKIAVNKHILLGSLALMMTASSGAFACDDYFARRDSIALGLGDASASNIATQTIDPWPPYARNTRIRVNGKRMQLGVTRYEQDKTKEPRPYSASELGKREGGGGGAAAGLTK